MATATEAPKQQTELQQQDKPQTQIVVGDKGLQLSTLEDLYRFAKYVAASGFAPKGIQTAEAILVAIQHGKELGLLPMQALQSIAVINGRPGIYGDAALALVRASGLMEKYSQDYSGSGDKLSCTVTVKRKGEQPISNTFSVEDAKTANLWGKEGPWRNYPQRMLLFRARGFALRDAFGDVLKGMKTVEELHDYVDVSYEVLPENGSVEAAHQSAETQKAALRKAKQAEAKPEPAAPPAQSEAPKPPPKSMAAEIPAYESKVGAGKYAGIVQRHLDRAGVQSLPELSPDQISSIMADMEDALRERSKEGPTPVLKFGDPKSGKKLNL